MFSKRCSEDLSKRGACRGKVNIGSMLFVIAIFAGGYVGWKYWVPHWEYLKMKRIMKDVALTYQVTDSAQAAKDELLMLMRQEHISYDISDKDCLFHEGRSQLSIECEWTATIEIALPNKTIDLSKSYRRYISVGSNGIIEEY